MKVKIEISRLTELADDKYKENLVPLESEEENMDVSPDRIKELALQKLRAQNLQENQERRKGEPAMRRASMKILVPVAVLCALTVTAFAAANGGLEYFKSIFGDSVENSAQFIANPMQSERVGDYKVTVESVLTDGFTANVILSVEDVNGKKVAADNQLIKDLTVSISSQDEDGVVMYSSTEMSQFSTKKKQFYEIAVSSVSAGEAVPASQLVFRFGATDESAEMALDVTSYMPYLEALQQEADFEEENLTVMSLQISPMGALLHGREQVQQGGLEAPWVFLVLEDGSEEEVFSSMSFDSSGGETVMGGGGAVIGGPGQQEPLVTSTQGVRNEDNSIAMRAGFSRIIDLSTVKAVRINGLEYPVALR